MIKRELSVEITPTTTEIAQAFSAMDDTSHAIFFNELAMLADQWARPFCFQVQSIVDNPILTDAGRAIMRSLGEYGAET